MNEDRRKDELLKFYEKKSKDSRGGFFFSVKTLSGIKTVWARGWRDLYDYLRDNRIKPLKVSTMN